MTEGQSFNLQIRRLWPADKSGFREHLLRLDAHSRHERFGGGMSDEFLARYAEHCFGKGDLLYGAFSDSHMCGRGRTPFGYRDLDRAGSFRPPYPRRGGFLRRTGNIAWRGIGEKLFKRILRAATNHGVETIEIVCLPDNVGMRRLAQKFKTQFTFEESALTGKLTARRPTPFSLMREASSDIADFGAAWYDAQLRAMTPAPAKDN